MDRRKDFDNIIKSTLHKNTSKIKASRNIFDEAWIRKDEKLIENNYSTIRSIVRVAIVAACLITLVFTTVVVDTSKARSIAMEIYKSLRTIFVVEKVGDKYLAVEKSEDMVYEFENLGSITIDDNKRSNFEDILGFKLHFPNRIGEYYNRSFYPSARITVFNVKLRDIERYRHKFLQAIGNEQIYSELSDFDMQRSVYTQYTDKNGEGFLLYIRKHIPKYFPSNAKVIKKSDIDGVDFEIIEATRAMYPWKLEGGWRFEDMTQEPEKIIKLYYLVWDYNGVRYSIIPSGIPGEKVLDEEKAIKFAKSYMESLKAESN